METHQNGRVPGYDFSFSDHEAVEAVLHVDANDDEDEEEEEEEGHHKDVKKEDVESDNAEVEKVDAKYHLDPRDGDALKELVTAALLKTRKSQVFLLLLIPALFFFFFFPTCSSSIFPTWLITTISTSFSCFAALLALITFQQRAVAFENVIERLT